MASLPRTPKSNPPQLKAHAQREERSGRLGKAIELLEELLRQSPCDWTAVQRLANLRARNGDRRAAVDLFRRLAEHYEQDGHFSRAIAVWRIVLRQDPASLGTHARLGELYAGQGFRIEARRHFETAIAGFKRQRREHEAARFQGMLDALEGTPSVAPTPGVDDGRAEGSVPPASSAEAQAADTGEGFDPLALDEREFVAERLVEAKMFRRYNLLPQARAALDSLLQRAPDNAEARKELVEVLRDAGETKEAAEEQRRLAPPETEPVDEASPEPAAETAGHPAAEEPRDPAAVMVPVPGETPITDAAEAIEIDLQFPDEGIRDEHALAAQEAAATGEPEGELHAFALDDILEEVFEGGAPQAESEPQPGESAAGAGMPIDDVVRLFREGVEQQLGKENYEARYDLGIAYREMGLLDEAIAEFQLAARGEGRQVECASLLGGCFLEKGLPELSVKWLERGLATPGAKDEEQIALRYELGHALEAAGRVVRALEVFTELYGDAAGYRDVVARVERLRSSGGQDGGTER